MTKINRWENLRQIEVILESSQIQGDALSPTLFNFYLKYGINKGQKYQVGLKLNWEYQLLAYAGDVNLLGIDTDTSKHKQTNSVALRPRAKYTDWATFNTDTLMKNTETLIY
jgi:hypothetical protein